jgi:AcrR family transcriptional regulator
MKIGDKEAPRTARGQRTRQKLVDAARVVFERDGFLDSKLTDISDEAGMSVGSFYTYFDSKEAIFEAVLDQAREEMLHPEVPDSRSDEGPIATIETANRAYLEAYRRNARLMALLEQASTTNETLRQLKVKRLHAFRRRNGRAIADLQRRGLADPVVDPYLAADALSHMVSRMAYESFVLGDGWELDELVAGLTRIWANALQLRDGDERT